MKVVFEKKKLSEILDLKYGKGLSKSKRINGPFPVYGSAGVIDSHNSSIVKGPGIVVGRKGSIGTVYFEKRDFFPIDTVYYVKVFNSKEIDLKFLYYLLKQSNLKNLNSDSAVPGLNRNDALRQEFKIPKFDLQKKIAFVLSNYDDLIKKNLKTIKLLDECASDIYKEWFINFRFSGYKKVILRNTDIGKIPDDWEVKSINKIVNIKSGFSFKSENYTKNGKYGLVTIKNVKDGGFNNKIKDFIDEIPANMPRYCYINSGDILLSLTGNVGRICLACNGNYLLNQRVAKIKPLEPIDKAFIYFFFRQKKLQKKMELMSTGTAQQNLSPIKLGKLNLLIPNEKIRKSFAEINNPILAQINILNNQVEKLNETKNLLLSNLIFSNFDISKIDIKTLDKAL